MNAETRQESGWRYVFMALLIFMVLSADVLSLFVGKLLDGRPLSDPEPWSRHWTATVGMFLCSVVIWSATTILIIRWIRRRNILPSLFSRRLDRSVVFFFCLAVLVLAAILWLEASRSGAAFPSLAREYHGFVRRYSGHGALVTAFQYLYYLLESVMVLLMIAFFQRAGEVWTRLAGIPWGGIGLTLTWGLAHFLSHPDGAFTVVLSALLLGLIFIGVRKSFLPALAAIYLVFVL